MADTIRWARTWTDAARAARGTGKLVFIDFYADWCTYCHKLEKEVFPDPRVVATLNSMVPLRLNTEREGRELAAKYGVSSLPTLMILDAAGTVQGLVRGFKPADALLEDLRAIVSDAKEMPAMLARLKGRPNDLALAKQVVERSLRRGNAKDAQFAANILEKAQPGKQPFMTYALLGQHLMRGGSGADARFWLGKAALRAPGDPEKGTCHFLIGMTWYRERNVAKAKECLEKALRTPGIPDRLAAAARQGLLEMGGRR
ncbi:MAG: thioredoxin fold domain-containing protein [Armatimonadota bacterium]